MSNIRHQVVARLTAALAFGLAAHAVLAAEPAPIDIAQTPLFLRQPEAPLNLLVMGRDHKLYYEAYNDVSDLNEDGIVDVGYKPASVQYYGLFDSNLCYTYASGIFSPSSTTSTRKCSGAWSGDFLNYLTTSRIDALRKVLYGGRRFEQSASRTVLERSYIPQDGHSWGKEYMSIAVDGYDIRDYTPLPLPEAGRRHLFGSVSLASDESTPLLRVLDNSPFRVWNWASIEGPVLGSQCVTSGNNRQNCVQAAGPGTWAVVPASFFPSGLSMSIWRRANQTHPNNATEFATLVTNDAVSTRLCGTRTEAQINGTGNPWAGTNSCTNDQFLTRLTGQMVVPAGGITVAIDGDDAVQLKVGNSVCVGWYGGHGAAPTDNSRTCTIAAGTHNIEFLHEEAAGGQSWQLRYQLPGTAASTMTDYTVRVEVCRSGFNEEFCRDYPRTGTPTLKRPAGLLQEYGEDDTMLFGLLTGSYRQNQAGGILRKEVVSFANEIDLNTGQFTTTKGIVHTIDRLKITGFISNSHNNGTGVCAGLQRPINPGECFAWGNPLAEMTYEGMRYFSGATAATSAFVAARSPNLDGTLDLPEVTWGTNTDPYRTGANKVCAKPFQTVISDINPSYDTDLLSAAQTINGQSLNAVDLGGTIWSHEFGGSRRVYIGEVGTLNDSAPTGKDASSFGNIRGLSPEEPTKKGGYYSASVALFGNTKDVNPAPGEQKVLTFSVALASPLPRIEFPVNGKVITMVPFGKTVSGTFGGDAVFKPTNTIVDFYVEALGNFPGVTQFPTVNNGLPFARFRINFEDVEQGNDHDMDAIVLYDLAVFKETPTSPEKLRVRLTSEYAAGSANQNMGYIISGTEGTDGIYLEVRDTDSPQSASAYKFNTPAGVFAGGCDVPTIPTTCELGFESDRVFEVAVGNNPPATVLRDPLWFAAKYGGFTDRGTLNGLPDGTEWDAKGPSGNTPDGNPDNYFLVTNALKLKEQLAEAFATVLEVSRPLGRLATNSTRISNRTLLFQGEYDSRDWTGDLKAYDFNETTLEPGALAWSAAEKLASNSTRKIFTWNGTSGQVFQLSSLTTAQKTALHASDDSIRTDLINYIKGVQTKEQQNGGTFRNRSKLLGDIANSGPAVKSRESYGYENDPVLGTSYQAYLAAKASKTDYVFVGANDGMLHAFNGSSGGGQEAFAFIPNAVYPNLKNLADPAYAHKFYVDGTPVISDAYIGGSWKTILVGTLGAGGKSVFALDISNPESFGTSNVLWEFSHADLGFTIGQAKIARLPNGTFVAIFGNGYNNGSNQSSLFVVNLATGALIRKIDTGVGTAADTNGMGSPVALDASGVARPRTDSGVLPYAQTTSGPDQFTFDLRVDTVFAGDLHGNLWKFDLSAQAPASWDFVKLFKALDGTGKVQRITGAPQAAAHPLGGVLVFFGTGRYFAKPDNDTVTTDDAINSFYAVWDSTTIPLTKTTSAITRSLMAPRTIGSEISVSGETLRTINAPAFTWGRKFGYYMDFSPPALPGERILAQPLVRFGRVFFNTFAPNINLTDNCQPGGRGFLMVLSAFAGAGAVQLANGQACAQCGGLSRSSDSPPGEPTLLTGDGVLVDVRPDFATGTSTSPASRVLTRPYAQLSWREMK